MVSQFVPAALLVLLKEQEHVLELTAVSDTVEHRNSTPARRVREGSEGSSPVKSPCPVAVSSSPACS